jgi:hypothetical protein
MPQLDFFHYLEIAFQVGLALFVIAYVLILLLIEVFTELTLMDTLSEYQRKKKSKRPRKIVALAKIARLYNRRKYIND